MFYKAKIGRKKALYWIDGPGRHTPNEPYRLFINCKPHGIFPSEEAAHEYVYAYLTH